MIPGTGPGRGFAWWRTPALVILRHVKGYARRESPDQPREGRTVAVISKESTDGP